jgi:sulfide:quinone oxidoreductase
MHVVVLGAGFGGLELATRLSEQVADAVRVTLIDRSAHFVFGFSKLEVLFGRQTLGDVQCSYDDVDLPGVEFRRELVTAIDPENRRVTTDRATYDADVLVVALGADYDQGATPGLVEDGFEFYSVAGAERLHERLATFTGGDIVLAVLGVPFKCPPAPYEGVLLLHDELVRRGIRDRTTLEVITPMPAPIPPSPSASDAICAALAERGIVYTPGKRVHSLDPAGHVALMTDGLRRYDLFIGIPVHRVPDVVAASGLTEGGADGWIAVEPRTLRTRFPGVYAIGDCADAPVPRAGVFAEAAARTVAAEIISTLRGGPPQPYEGRGVCYVEFGHGEVGKVDANFLGGPSPVVELEGPSVAYVAEKVAFGADRRRRWFARSVEGAARSHGR